MKHKVNPLLHHIEFGSGDISNITVKTARLIIRPIRSENKDDCIELYGDSVLMKSFGIGVALDESGVNDRLRRWLDQWGSRDPFGAYSIVENDSNKFVGVVCMTYFSGGKLEINYLISRGFQGEGYGSEAVKAVVQSLIPRLMLDGYPFKCEPVKKLVATARLDNIPSQKILKKVGFEEEKVIEKYGAPRRLFGLSAKKLENQYQQFFSSRDRRIHEKGYRDSVCEADVTAEEMARSSFGRGSHTARRIFSR